MVVSQKLCKIFTSGLLRNVKEMLLSFVMARVSEIFANVSHPNLCSIFFPFSVDPVTLTFDLRSFSLGTFMNDIWCSYPLIKNFVTLTLIVFEISAKIHFFTNRK